MLGPIKHKDFSRNRLRRNQIRILRHIPRPIDFPRMVNLLYDLNAWLRWNSMAAQLAPGIVVVRTVELVCRWARIALRDLDRGYLQVVLGLAGGVGPEKEAVCCVWFVCGSGLGHLVSMKGRGRGIGRTTLYRGTIGMLGWASRVHG